MFLFFDNSANSEKCDIIIIIIFGSFKFQLFLWLKSNLITNKDSMNNLYAENVTAETVFANLINFLIKKSYLPNPFT